MGSVVPPGGSPICSEPPHLLSAQQLGQGVPQLTALQLTCSGSLPIHSTVPSGGICMFRMDTQLLAGDSGPNPATAPLPDTGQGLVLSQVGQPGKQPKLHTTLLMTPDHPPTAAAQDQRGQPCRSSSARAQQAATLPSWNCRPARATPTPAWLANSGNGSPQAGADLGPSRAHSSGPTGTSAPLMLQQPHGCPASPFPVHRWEREVEWDQRPCPS